MGNNYFRFKQFTVNQNGSAMRVNTDGVLLGAWMSLEPADKYLLDVGTGTGVIALMAAQRLGNSLSANKFVIHAIDKDSRSYADAEKNFKESQWCENLYAENISFQNFSKINSKKIDFIFTNPPYFTDSLKSPDKEKTGARHNDTLSQADLINGVTSCLREGGRFALILPSAEAMAFIGKINFLEKLFLREEGKGCFLQLSRRCNVIYKAGDVPQRVMMEFVFKQKGADCTTIRSIDKTLTISGNTGYTQEYMHLTKEFYLNF